MFVFPKWIGDSQDDVQAISMHFAKILWIHATSTQVSMIKIEVKALFTIYTRQMQQFCMIHSGQQAMCDYATN